MRKLSFLISLLFLAVITKSQNPGLLISEVMINPPGTDSCKEYVELIATKNINFSLTPYTIIVNNNGAANINGWVAGGALTYAFEVNTGSVSTGDVVYVGGSCMAPTGPKIKVLNVKYVGGDGGIGNANAAGVFGNGGSNADGVAVFDVPVASITSSTVPRDAVFYGTGLGTAIVNAGLDGYQLPVNDFYNGGKLNASSYFTNDPGADILTFIGLFNTTTNTWSMARTYSFTPESNLTTTSSVSLTSSSSGPMTLTFLSHDTTVVESSSLATVYVRLTASSTSPSTIQVQASTLSNATSSDYTLATTQITVAANTPVNTAFPVNILINNDTQIESDEYVVLRLTNPVNAVIGATNQCNFYIADNDKPVPAPSNALTLNLLSSFSNSLSGSNSAEIVAHDPTTQRLYIANSIGNKVDIVNFINPSSPSLLASISVTPYGSINSLAVRNGTVACAIENSANPQDSGKVVFLDKDGNFLKQVKVGMMPDMITYNHAGTKVLTANEGEPNDAYTNDPDGSVSIIDISGGITNLTQSNVAHVTFTVYNGQEATLKSQGIRIFGPFGMASKDFEPEYITIAPDDSKAWVALQENNAIVEINLSNNNINYIKALGTKDHAQLNNGMDVSNLTKGVNISNFPVKGFYMPDAIACYTVGANTYIISANEGDAREYSGFSEVKRINQVNLDPVKFPNATEIKNNYFLGRLNITDKSGDIDNDGDLDTIYCYGSRSFSIWNAATGVQVYDSKDDMELITATNSFSVMFNASNTSATKKDRSDDKGPEPEGVALGVIGGNTYAFIALERIGGVMVYDVSNPLAPVFVTYVNNRTLPSNGPDRGAEGIIFIPQSQSPNGQHIVIAANEVSSTLSIWGIPGCSSPVSSSLSVSGSTLACSNQAPALSVPSNAGFTYQWYNGASPVSGATSNTFSPTSSGNYSVLISGGPNCQTKSLPQVITINPSPTITISGSSSVICIGQSATLTASGASGTYTWNNNSNSVSIVISPSVNTTYSVVGANANGCTGTSSFVQNVTNCTSLEEESLNTASQIYPNPTSSTFAINFNEQAPVNIDIYTMQGKQILHLGEYHSGDLISVDGLAKGVYFVRMHSTNFSLTKKLIVN